MSSLLRRSALGLSLLALAATLPALAQPRRRHHRPTHADAGAADASAALPPNPYLTADPTPSPAPDASAPVVDATVASVDVPAAAPDVGAVTVAVVDAGARPAANPSIPPNPYAQANSLGRRYGALDEADIIAALRSAPIRGAREVGNTSINLHCDLEGDIDGAYKPSERRHAEHWRAEIGAFRVSQILGIERVPPAVFRRVPQGDVPAAIQPRVYFNHGVSRGAMIYWVPVLHRAGIFSGQALEQWTNLLVVGVDLPDRERLRAEEISTLIAFDYIIGNWDRWHGTNTLTDGQGHLVYRDNNGGFLEPLPRGRHEIILSFLQRVQRFSRAFVERARAFTLADLRRAIAQDGDGAEPLLSEAQLRSVIRRRNTLIQYVDALVNIHGEDEVLFFP
ncbi:MAG: hypothetical protein R3A52_08420 [Polyangiales bacterium]